MTEARASLAVEIKDRTRRGAMSAARSFNTIKRNAAAANKQIIGFGKSMTGLGGGMSTIGRQIGTGMGFAALAGFVSNAVGEFIKFEKAMLEVKTLLPAASNEMGTLTQNVRDLAKEFGTDTQIQAKALYQTISAGAANAAEAQMIQVVANKLAIGGVTDVATAVDGLTTALNAYGFSSSEAMSVSNQMFIAMKAGKTTIPELAQSLSFIAPVAAQTGVSMGEVLAATAALTKAGVPTQRAMRGLAQTIAMIIKPSGEAAKMAAALNEEAGETVIQFNAAALEALGLVGFLDMVAKATGGSAEKMAQLFGGVESLLPVLALTGTQAGALTTIYKDMQEEFAETDTAYGTMADSIAHKTKMMQAEWQSFVEAMGKGITEGFVTAIRGYNKMEDLIDKQEARSWKRAIEQVDEIDKLFGTSLGSLFADETRARLPTTGWRGIVQDAGTASWDAEKGKWREPPAYGLPADRDMPPRLAGRREEYGTLLQPLVDTLDKWLSAIAAVFPEGELGKYVDRRAELPGGGGLGGISQFAPPMEIPGQYLDPERGLIDVGGYGPEDWSASLENMLTGWTVTTDEASVGLSVELNDLSEALAALSGGSASWLYAAPPSPEDGEPKETASQALAREQKQTEDALASAKKTADEKKRIAKETTTAEEMIAEARRKTSVSTFELSLHGLSVEAVQQKRLEQFQAEEIAALALLATGDEKQAALLAEHELQKENLLTGQEQLLKDKEKKEEAKAQIQITTDQAAVEDLLAAAREKVESLGMSLEQQELARVRVGHKVARAKAVDRKATDAELKQLDAVHVAHVKNIEQTNKDTETTEGLTDRQQTLNRIYDEATGIASKLAPELSNMFNAINAFAQKDYIGAASSAIHFMIDMFVNTNDEAKKLSYTFDELSSSIRSSVSSAESAIIAAGGAGSEEVRRMQMDTVEPMLEFFKEIRGGIEGERRSEVEDFRDFVELMGLIDTTPDDLRDMTNVDQQARYRRVNEILANFMDAFVEGGSRLATAPDEIIARGPQAGETDEEKFFRLEKELAEELSLTVEELRKGSRSGYTTGLSGGQRSVTFEGETAMWEEGFSEALTQFGRGNVDQWRDLLEEMGVAGYEMSAEMRNIFEAAFGEDTLAEIAVNMFSVRDAFDGVNKAANRLVPTAEEVAHRLEYRGEEISAGARFAEASRLSGGDVFLQRKALLTFEDEIKSIRESMSAAESRLGGGSGRREARDGGGESGDDVSVSDTRQVLDAPAIFSGADFETEVAAADAIELERSTWAEFGVFSWSDIIQQGAGLKKLDKFWHWALDFDASTWGEFGVTRYSEIIKQGDPLAAITKPFAHVFKFQASPWSELNSNDKTGVGSYGNDIIKLGGPIKAITKPWAHVFKFQASPWSELNSNDKTGVGSYGSDIIKLGEGLKTIEKPWAHVFKFTASPWSELNSNNETGSLDGSGYGSIIDTSGDLKTIAKPWAHVFKFTASPWSDLNSDNEIGLADGYGSIIDTSGDLGTIQVPWGDVIEFTDDIPKMTLKVEDVVEFDPDFSASMREMVVEIVKEAILDRDLS